MEEARGEDESILSTIEVFVCYAREDEEYRQRLEKQLSIFQREGLIRIWHDGNISPGEEWEEIIHIHLNTAQIVLLLVSPDFMASNYCYHVEMQTALERHTREETRVIPVLVRPIHWDKGPLGKLQALPKNAKPIALWRHRDEAFFDVAEGIRRVIEEREAQPTISPLSDQQLEHGGKKRQNVDVLEQEFLSREPLVKYKAHQEPTDVISPKSVSQSLIHSPSKTPEDEKYHPDGNIYKRNHRNRHKRRLLVPIAILLVLVVSLISFVPFSACSLAFCHSSLQPTKQPSPQQGGEVHDQNLSVGLVAVVSPSFVLPDDPKRYSGGITSPTNISAVSLARNISTYDTIIINVQNLRYGGADILIDSVALKLLSIPPVPRPLKVWTPGVATTYLGYSYPVMYTGQTPGQLLYAKPSRNVILAPAGPNHLGESDPLSLQVMSTVTAFLRFQVEITYQIIGAPLTLTLPQIFQVVFSDASNWQEGSL